MRRNTEYFMIGTVVGAVLGVVAGLLLAPASGAKTRAKLSAEARRAADAALVLAERAERAAEKLEDAVDHYLGRDDEAAWRKVKEIREGVQRYTQTQAG